MDAQLQYESSLNAAIAALQLITGPIPGLSNRHIEMRMEAINALMKKRGFQK